MAKDYLKAVPKGDKGKSSDQPENLVDMLQYIDGARQEIYEMLESLELVEEEIKQALYAEQGSRKK